MCYLIDMNTYHVYAVVNRETQDAYIGTTRRLARRWKEHQWKLSLNRHPSRLLQAAWNDPVRHTFEFVVIWTIIDSTLDGAKRAELYWISQVGTYNDLQADLEAGKFKMMPEAREIAGARNRNRGATPEYRAVMAAHTKRRWADPVLRLSLLGGGRQFTKDNAPRKTAEMDAAHSAHMKEVWADPVKRIKLAERLASVWTVPGAKERHGERMRKQHAARRAAKAAASIT